MRSSTILPPIVNQSKVFVFQKKMTDTGFRLPSNAFETLKRYKTVHQFLAGLLLHGYVNVNAVNFCGESLLYWLCQYYQDDDLTDIVELVCRYGADVNFCHPADGSNPLMALIKRTTFWPRSFYNLKIVTTTLVEHGLDVCYIDYFGKDVISAIMENKQLKTSEVVDFINLLGGTQPGQ